MSFEHLPLHIRDLISVLRDRNMTYLSDARLEALATTCIEHERDKLPGDIIETGCALGGSAVLLCACKSIERQLSVYDVFGMIPAPSERDGPDVHARYATIKSGQSKGIGGSTYYGYMDNLYDQVKCAFTDLGYPLQQHNIALIKGMLQDTLKVEHAVSLAHIDVDWYEPVLVCLSRIYPQLSVGGRIIVDDYQDWSGCRMAVDEFVERVPNGTYTFDLTCGSLMITKLSDCSSDVGSVNECL